MNGRPPSHVDLPPCATSSLGNAIGAGGELYPWANLWLALRQGGVVVWWERRVWTYAAGWAETELQTVQCSAVRERGVCHVVVLVVLQLL
jgi:hypothetical protein